MTNDMWYIYLMIKSTCGNILAFELLGTYHNSQRDDVIKCFSDGQDKYKEVSGGEIILGRELFE